MLTSHKRCWLNVGTAYPVHTLVVPTPTLYASMTYLKSEKILDDIYNSKVKSQTN